MPAPYELLFASHVGPVVPWRGRYYITAGHAGFNCRANNCEGYATEAKALAARAGFIKRAGEECARIYAAKHL